MAEDAIVTSDKKDTPEITPEQLDMLFSYALAQRYRTILSLRHGPPLAKSKISRDKLARWLKDPARCERQLRDASRYLYEYSGQYKRLCNYQPNMLKLSYIIVPDTEIDETTDIEEYKKAYMKTAYSLNVMNIRTEFNKPLCTASVDGIAYAYTRSTKDTFSMYILDPNYCRMSSIDGTGCIRFEFNFSYFDTMQEEDRESLLATYGKEFRDLYEKHIRSKKRWYEIGEDGMCIKFQENILEYAMPPYIAVLDHLLDLDDYRKLAKAKEENGNYNLLNFKIPTNKDGKILMDLGVAKKFIEQASSEVPETIGVLYSPMEVQKFNFSKDNDVASNSAVTAAVDQFWEASGVSSLLFGSGKSSANALNKSIIADEVNIYPLMRQIERWINRRLRLQHSKYKFRIKFLDITSFNEQDKFDSYMKAGNAGVPVKTAIASTFGYTPYEVMQMASLENDMLDMRGSVYNEPLLSSSHMSEQEIEAGRPLMDEDDLTESGEITRENETNVRE